MSNEEYVKWVNEKARKVMQEYERNLNMLIRINPGNPGIFLFGRP